MSSVTQTSLEALIMKATHESLPQPDEAAVEAFCTVLRDASDGPLLAAQAVAARMQSPNPREAMLALIMLDRCMRRCDANFHAEIGKFRFLNEMIKLVSPKYYADRTSAEVRTRVLQLLHAWSIEYPKETKFKVAYDMLRNQGVITETPPPLPPEDHPVRPREKNATFEDEEKSKLLRKLLRSKNPEDLQHANKLIKTMVREEERKNEANCRRSKEVGTALDNAELLQDMLEHAFNDPSPEEEQLMEELYNTCVRYRPILERMSYGQTQAAMINKILLAGDAVDDAIDKYDAYLAKKRRIALGHPTLLDFAGAMNGEPGNKHSRKAKAVLNNMGIYDQRALSCAIVEFLKPQPENNLMETIAEDNETGSEKEIRPQGWDELDFLGEQLLKQALPENAKRAESFNGKSGKKIPMNALEKSSPKHDAQSSSNGAFFDLDFFTKSNETAKQSTAQTPKPSTCNDDLMVDISINAAPACKNDQKNNGLMDMLDLGIPSEKDAKTNNNNIQNLKEDPVDAFLRNPGMYMKKSQAYEVKPLSDIFMTLQSVQPSKVPPLTAFEEQAGITVVLHFCKNKPRADVSVIVISTTSKNSSPIIDYKFHAVVPKNCKVRLLTPSATSLPAYNPFLPPPALTQMMLIGRPPATPVNLKFVLTYTCNDEMFSEMGEVDVLPLDQI